MVVSKSLLRILFAAALLPTVALAGPLADAAKKAEEQAAAGDTVGAHNTVRDAFGTFAATLPFTIGKAVSASIEMRTANAKLKAEIAKCVVLCHNCHAKVHAGHLELPASASVAQR